MTAPGRLLYERVRALRRAKHRFLLSRVTVVPREPGKVLQFPNKKEVTDGANLRSGEDSDLG
jgi:hypothetical protein